MALSTPAASHRLPTLYIGHGAPLLLDDPVWAGQLRGLASTLPRPKAILIISAHWESAPVSLTAAGPATDLVYDFGGFDPKYYALRYDTPDATTFAERVKAVLPATMNVHQHNSRGLDHGAWVPLMLMYPEADIPVLQMSLPTSDPYGLIKLGESLRPLRDEGVLIIGSGFLTHGLPFLRDWRIDAEVPAWSSEFDLWAAEALAAGDADELSQFRTKAPGMPFAHPTVEHFTPLFVTLGTAVGGESLTTVIDGYWMGLSKRSVLVA